MRSIALFFGFALMAATLAACGSPAANNTNTANTANTNSNTAGAAPTAAALLEMEKKAFEAWSKKDGKFFEGFLAENFVSFSDGKRSTKADEVKMISENKCEVKSFSLADEKMVPVGPDAAVLVAKATLDGTCDGQKIPATMTTATLYVRSGDSWKAAYHGETAVVDPKAPAPAKADDKKDDAKKEEAKADDKKDDKAASNTNASNAAPAPVKPTSGANTEALVKIHQAGWEAFKSKDAKWFDANMASSFAFIDPIGGYVGTKADAIKTWTETMKCEGITTVKVSDGVATSVSPTVEVLTLKGTADGMCDGQKNGPLWQTAIYHKEGDAWKLAFMIEAPAM